MQASNLFIDIHFVPTDIITTETMKRSEINTIMRDAIAFTREMRFHLPPFAFWTPDEWVHKTDAAREIVEAGLGWDITDFGSGNFPRKGLFLFTLRNGITGAAGEGPGKRYAEKIMIVREDQVTPIHFHYSKMEDIINRGGGNLSVRVWNATDGEQLAGTEVVVSIDGTRCTLPAGGLITLRPGESVCLPPRLYHAFQGETKRGTVLVGEVSLVNDDHADNRFLEPTGRFPVVEEDEPLLYPLVGDYRRVYRPRL